MKSPHITPNAPPGSLEGSIPSARIPCGSRNYAESVARSVANQSENAIRFTVPGTPAPGGSKRFLGISKKTGRGILVDASGERGANWRIAVQWAAKEQLIAGATAFPPGVPLTLVVDFIMPRPKSHFRANGTLKPTAPSRHTTKPDTTKLLRAVEDAITSILWHDDAQISLQIAAKTYGETPGATISIIPILLP